MVVTLLDYSEARIDFDIGNLEDINRAVIEVISGDEVLSIEYKNGEQKMFDTSPGRLIDYYDELYTLYDYEKGINRFLDEAWLARRDSYDVPF